MNKKFLSVILFSALMVGTAGTFTSCKDYDDDIEQINNELTGIKASISELQAKIGDGKFVTNVTKSGDGIVVTWNDNSTSTIETIKGDKGDKGDKVEITIDPATKNWKIDGVDTGICAEGKNGSGTNGVNAKSPSISETTGNWVVYEWDAEKQEYVGTDTGISAKGASAYVVDKGNYYELNVAVDKAGSAYTTVKLPKYPTTITEIEVLGQTFPNGDGSTYVNAWNNGAQIPYHFKRVTAAQAKKWNDLKGTKKLKEDQVLSTLSNGNLLLRVAPAALDASAFSFKMVNSMQNEAPITLGTPTAFNGLLTRAVSGNGLWTVAVSTKENETYKTDDDYIANFQTPSGYSIVYALQEDGGFTTLYNLSFDWDNTIDLSAYPIKLNNTEIGSVRDADGTWVTPATVGETMTVVFNNLPNVYDAYLEIDEATQVRWGITDIIGLSFKIGKLADNITTTYFPIKVHYVTLDGVTDVKTIFVKPAKSLGGVTVLESQNIEISATASKNKKEYSLTPMFNDLKGNALTLWKADVSRAIKTVYRIDDAYGNKTVMSNVGVDFDKAAMKDITKVIIDVDNARIAKYDLDKSYYVEIKFLDGNNEVLNMVQAPFTLSIPTLSKFLVKENVVFGTTSIGKAYMNVKDQAAPYSADGISRYAFKHAFNKFDDVFTNSTIEFAIDPTQKIGNVAVKNYAKLINATNVDVAIELTNTEKAYGKDINIVISEAKYLGLYAYEDEERKANAFSLNVMSPIEQGDVVAANTTGISVVATADGTAKIVESDFKATTYANIAYKIFKDAEFDDDGNATQYSSKYINGVKFASANTNVFTVDEEGKVATEDSKGNITEGYVVVTPANAAYEVTEKMNVTVTDIWGYTKKASINVTVKPNSEK